MPSYFGMVNSYDNYLANFNTKISKGLVGWNVRNRYLLLQDIIGYCREVYKVLKYYIYPLVFEPNHQTILQQDYPDSQEDHHI